MDERKVLEALEDAFMVGTSLQIPTSEVEVVNERCAARGRGMCDAVRNIASRLGIELGVPV